MSNFSNVGDDPNDKMPPSEPLGPEEAVPEDDDLDLMTEHDDDADELSEADRENQASTEGMNPKKFQPD